MHAMYRNCNADSSLDLAHSQTSRCQVHLSRSATIMLMFAARPFAPNTVPAFLAGAAARAITIKTTITKG